MNPPTYSAIVELRERTEPLRYGPRRACRRGRGKRGTGCLPGEFSLLCLLAGRVPACPCTCAGRTFDPLPMPQQTTYSAKPGEIERRWYVIDAEGETLGRLSTRIANTLRGKLKPTYTPHVDTGDFVVVVNCERIRVTGKKMQDKIYYRHSGYHGGLRERTLAQMLDARPEEVIRHAVRGMLPRNKLGRAQLRKLKVYARGQNPHEGQQPAPLP